METKPVNMRLPQTTLNKIDLMKKRLQAPNRTQVVINSIRIANDLTKLLPNGGIINIEKPNGKLEKLFLSTF